MNSNKIKEQVFRGIKFILVFLIMIYVIKKSGGVKMFSAMKQADPFWLSLSFLSFFLSIVLGSYQWYCLLKLQKVNFSRWDSFKTYYSGMFINAVIFNLAGDALRVYKLKKSEADIAKSFSATFMDRFMGLFILSLFSLASVGLIGLSGQLAQEKLNFLFYSSLSVFLVFLIGSLILASKRFGRVFQFLLNMMGLRKLEGFYEKIRHCMLMYRQHWKNMILVGFLSMGVHSLRILGHYLSALALGIEISIFYFFCFIPIISLTTLIPLNLGGWGMPQEISRNLYGLAGVIVAFPPGMESLKIAVGSLTFLPSITFSLVMLAGGVFIINQFGKPTKETLGDLN